ncbi:hypothetical protein SAMN05216215_1003212 [Saccharopolyspora shandongensis]|uniref:Uncharacterized protein n=1 Tax=Saccharopolyspora shandongensis TaxID=418495 RepID=A0A1H2TSR8_9PSEU|nr:hypothetical protein [Saccharopolyspora shandongensis]SDW46966.1 hypothetical protein SAMN05216215_1003212 [Saccharopolyspora shandongensis]
MTEHDTNHSEPGPDDTLQRGLTHNEWHRTHQVLVDQWDADLFGKILATE